MKLPCAARFGLGLLGGLALVMALIALYHARGWTAPASGHSYPYTQAIARCLSPGFVIAAALIAGTLGFLLRRALAPALGMILPLPFAAALEMSLDPTSHNLIPFEILLSWAPSFGLALLCAWLGSKLRRRLSRDESPAEPPPLP